MCSVVKNMPCTPARFQSSYLQALWHQNWRIGVRLDDLIRKVLAAGLRGTNLRENWPADFDNAGMVRVVRYSLGYAYKLWIESEQKNMFMVKCSTVRRVGFTLVAGITHSVRDGGRGGLFINQVKFRKVLMQMFWMEDRLLRVWPRKIRIRRTPDEGDWRGESQEEKCRR